MKLSKKCEYALRALTAMARDPGALYTIPSISRDQDIPPKFLEQILLSLRQAGLLNSRRGAGGGYSLSRAPSLIRVAEVLGVIGGPDHQAVPSKLRSESSRAVDRFLAALESEIHAKLDSTTIADLLHFEAQPGAANFEI